MKGLTPKQQATLDVIRDYCQRKGHPPTVREVAEALGVRSSCSAQRHLDALERKGYIERNRCKFRSIRLLETVLNTGDSNLVHVPLIGTVAAGQPILATENLENTFVFSPELLPSGDLFMLRVQGDSMIEAGISDGDFVVIRKQEQAQEGDIVAALVGEEATLKAFYRDGDRIRLQPRNASLAPIYTSDVVILGKAVLAVKRLD